MSLLNRVCTLSLLLMFSWIPTAAQTLPKGEENNTPLDPSIRSGRLKNGLTYFIKPIEGSHSRLYLQLHHKVGINQEDEDQGEISHAVEHLAFKGTENFPSGIHNNRTLQNLGVGRNDISANNGRRGTNYFIEIPHQSSEALDIAFLWFSDIIGGLKLTDTNIAQVSGELRQETILRIGDMLNNFLADTRLYSSIFSCGKDLTKSLQHETKLDKEVVKRFYNDWNRTDLVAISIVGKIDNVDLLERHFNEAFSNITRPQHPRKLEDCDMKYYSRPPQFHLVERQQDTLKVLQNNKVKIHHYFRDSETKTSLSSMRGHERLLLMQLLSNVLNSRFRNGINHYDSFRASSQSPYIRAGFPPSLELIIQSEKGMEEELMKRVSEMLNQLKIYGVTDEEWESIKKVQQAYLRKKDTTKASFWQKEIERFYLYDEALPHQKYAHLSNWLENLKLEDFQKYLHQFLSTPPEDIGIIAPIGLSYSESEVRSWVESGYKKLVEPYELLEGPSSIMNTEEVRLLDRVNFQDIGFGPSGSREGVLENGIKVVFKERPMVGTNPKIKFHGFSLNGANLFPEEHYYSAINSPAIVRNAGVNGLTKSESNRFLSSTSIRPGAVFPYIVDKESGIIGEAGVEDIETLFQLIYLYLTKPNFTLEVFNEWKNQVRELYRTPSYDLADVDFQNAIKVAIGEKTHSESFGKKYFQGTNHYEGMQKTNFEVAKRVYSDIFRKSGTTFIISGQFEADSILSLVQKYLGNLPIQERETALPTRVPGKNKVINGPLFLELPSPEYYRMKNMIYGFKFIHQADDAQNWKEQLRVEALGAITNNIAWNLRNLKGYSLYNIGVRGKFNYEMQRYEISSTFHCVPEEFEAIREEIKTIISDIKAGNFSEGEFQQGMERMYYLHSPKSASRPILYDQRLYNHYRYGLPWIDPIKIDAFVRSITIKDIIETAHKYFKEEHLFEFIMKDKSLYKKNISKEPFSGKKEMPPHQV